MTVKCTYLGENILPKDSLLYNKFMALNELNNLKINSRDITVELKQQIYKDLFLKNNKVASENINGISKSTKGIKLIQQSVTGIFEKGHIY